jgi:glutathionylspermidine synthase
MERHSILPRPDWQKLVSQTGLTFHSVEGAPYWDESAYWEFSSAEIDRIEAATSEIQRLCLAAGDHVIEKNRFREMQIPDAAIPYIVDTWQQEPPALYGRLDLVYDGRDLKLLEYNADTPTSLLEAAVIQWYWLQDRFPHADQFNSLHEKLIAKWKDLTPYISQPVHFGYEPVEEDRITIEYLRDTAHQAGLRTAAIAMHDIGWHSGLKGFVDLGKQPMRTIFKLYPWETMLKDSFGEYALASMKSSPYSVQWIEPIWKMLWSNKALLTILWELFPGHELLLPAYLDGPRNLHSYVRKPILGREGGNITVCLSGITMESTGGNYSDNAFVYQQYAELAASGNSRAVIGSWLIDGEPAGIGVRESNSYVTGNTSRFVPHLFR